MQSSEENDGSRSVCAQPKYKPVTYHWFAMNSGRRILDEVRAQALAAGVPAEDTERLLGEFNARARALVQGKLRPIRHVKGPMRTVTDIDVYEIRAGIEFGEADEVHVRAYHVEPRDLKRCPGPTVVGLHVHMKDLSNPATVDVLQDAELQIARDRFHAGRASMWGGATLSIL